MQKGNELMTGIYFLAYTVLYSVEPIVWTVVLQKLFILQRQKIFIWVAGIVMYITIVAKQYTFFLQENTIVTSLFMPFFMAYLFLMVNFLYKISITESIICVTSIILFSTLADVIALAACHIFFSMDYWNVLRKAGLENLFGTLLSKVCLLVFYWISFSRKKTNQAYQAILSRKAMIYVIPNIAMVTFFYIFLHNTNITGTHYLVVLLLFLLDVVFMLYISIQQYAEEAVSREKEKQEMKIRLHSVEQELKLYEEIEKSKQELRKLRHDMGEHLEILNNLCERKYCGEAREYAKQINSAIGKAQDICLLKDTKVAVFLNMKKRTAREHGIEFRAMIATEQFYMKDIDLCSLLSNLLNNAEEAVEKQSGNGRKFMRLVVEQVRDGCSILCENSMEVQPIVKDGKILSTKENPKEHGLGIQIIKDIVKKYNGSVKFQYGEEIFSVKILVRACNKDREENENGRE